MQMVYNKGTASSSISLEDKKHSRVAGVNPGMMTTFLCLHLFLLFTLRREKQDGSGEIVFLLTKREKSKQIAK